MYLAWSEKRLFWIFPPLLLLSVGLFYYFTAHEKPRDLNVVLITIDALRADHLGCYGYKRNTSPNIDRLAKEGALFTQAIAQAPSTPPSMGVITTSTYPPVNGLRGWGCSLKPGLPTLPKALKNHGYRTLFIGGNENFREGLRDFDQGFDVFYEKALPAKDLTRKAVELLGKAPATPFFLWVHYMDVHDYNPEKRLENAFMSDPFYDSKKNLPIVEPSPSMYGHNGIASWLAKKKGGADNPDYYVSLYDAGILSVDEQVGVLLRSIKVSADRNTLVIITADHGEMLGEHGLYFQHGIFLHEPLIRVPFILYDPGLIPAQEFNAQIRAGLDIFPTILDFLKIRKPKSAEGTALLRLLAGNGAGNPPYVLMDGNRFERGVRTEDWKLTYYPAKKSLPGTYALFDLKGDPGETTDVSLVEKPVFAALKKKLSSYAEKFSQERESAVLLGEETRKNLKSLGYLQ